VMADRCVGAVGGTRADVDRRVSVASTSGTYRTGGSALGG
jgi:hypothetical protein